jgi:cell division protein FtsX
MIGDVWNLPMSRRFQFALIALLVVMLFVTAFFAAMSFFFYRNFIEVQKQLSVEQKNSANRESMLRDKVRELIKAEDRIKELESR